MHFQTSRLLLIAVFIVSILPILAQPPEPPKADYAVGSNYRKTLDKFVKALNDKNFKKAASYVAGGQTEVLDPKLVTELEKLIDGWSIEIQEFEGVPLGKHTELRVPLRLQHRLRIKIDRMETLTVLTEEKKIVPLSPEEMQRITYNDEESPLLSQIATYLARPKDMERIHGFECMKILKQVALGALRFVNDHDDKLAFKPQNYREALEFYGRDNTIIFFCPLKKNDESYSFNAKLENVAMGKIVESQLTVLFYEGKDGKLDFRHDNRAAVAFANGDVKLVTPEEAKTLLWTP